MFLFGIKVLGIYRVFPDAQISAFCRILNANVPHFAWQCAQMGAIFRFLRRFGPMSNSGNRRLNLHLVVDCNHPCDIDRFIWFPTQKSAGCDNRARNQYLLTKHGCSKTINIVFSFIFARKINCIFRRGRRGTKSFTE